MIVIPSGEKIKKVVRLGFKPSNNEVYYEAIIYALRTAKVMGAICIQLFIDSKLFAIQFEGVYKVRCEMMVSYLNVLQ